MCLHIFHDGKHLRPPNLTVDQKFQNQDGGRRPSWKSKNFDISKTVKADFADILYDNTY